MAPSIPGILTGTLPSVYPGPNAVGYASLRNLPRHPTLVPSPRYPTHSGGGRDGKEVLGVREVGYAVFYPCEERKRGWWGHERVAWLIRPVHTTLAGYAKFAGNHPVIRLVYPIMRVLGGRLKIPVHPLAPLRTNVSTSEDLNPTPSARLPLIIFSHGLAGMHTAYSHYCASLASQGYVVLAVGHRDGSGPAYVVRPQQEGADEGVRAEGIETVYIQAKELDWSPNPTPSNDELRSLQLDMRVAEIYEVYDSFRALVVSGLAGLRGPEVDTDDGKPSGTMDDFIATFRDRVEVEWDITLAGHSFGGGTLFSLLQSPPPAPFSRLPLSQAIALDPWVDPLPMPAPSAHKDDKPEVPLLVINSEGFTLWKQHFRRVLGLVKEAGGSFVTIVGCDHQSFSDFPMLLNAGPAMSLLSTINELSSAFLRNTFGSAPSVAGKTPDHGDVKTRREGKKEKMVGEFGEVVVHLLAEEGKSRG